jgi:hypothetical protein
VGWSPSDPCSVKTPEALNRREKLSLIAQNRPRSEIIVAVIAIPREILFYQFFTPLPFYTAKTQSGSSGLWRPPDACRWWTPADFAKRAARSFDTDQRRPRPKSV